MDIGDGQVAILNDVDNYVSSVYSSCRCQTMHFSDGVLVVS